MKTRREFIFITAASGAALLLGASPAPRSNATAWQPNAWIRIDPSGDVVVMIGKQEMGQGVRTSLAMIVAEELDLEWSTVRIEQASPGPQYTSLNTGGSGSIYRSWRILRPAAATAREMLLRAAAKEWQVDRASLRTDRGFIVDASGRRRSYGSVAAIAATLEVPKDVPLKSPKDFRIVGRPAKRIDGPAIVTGKAGYGLDVRVPGMKFAAIVRCPVVGGTLDSFDARDAKKIAGVEQVVAVPSGVAVVAKNTWAALKAAPLVKAVWNRGKAASFDSAAFIDSLLANGEIGVVTRREGDLAATTGTAQRLDAHYIYPFYVHAPLEPMNATARVTADRCEVWVPTQAPNRAQEAVAKELGLAPERVTIHPTLIGGGFGRRLVVDYAVEAALVSKAIGGAPVQVVWSRADDMQHGSLQHATVERMAATLDAGGDITSWSHTKLANPIMSYFPPSAEELADPAKLAINSSSGAFDLPYAIPSIHTSYVSVPTPVRYGPWRSVDAPSSVFARECFFDELARAAGRDPLQLRIDLLGKPDVIKAGPLTLDRARLRRVLETVRSRSSWGKNLGQGRGQGVACNIYDEDTHVAYVVEVTVRGASWHVDRVVCAVDCGPVINPSGVAQQVEGGIVWALTQLMTEATIHNGEVAQRSFTDYAVPRFSDCPKIEVHVVGDEGPQPFGMGEPPVPPLAPAVLNAIFDATGKRIRRLPVRLS